MEKHIYFVRHGKTDTNTDRIYRGRDEMLTDEGREQAAVVAERIKRIGVDAVVSSTFDRAKETAAAIGQAVGLTPETSEYFIEWLEPSSLLGLRDDHPDRVSAFETIFPHDDHYFRYEDEETFAELVARAEKCMAFIKEHPAERLCVVTHGAFLKIITGVCVFEDHFTKSLFRDMYYRFAITNTGITEIRWSEKRPWWRLVTWNDQSHLG